MAGVLHEIAVRGLFADVVLLVVAMALRGVERNGRRAAGPLGALRVRWHGLDGLVQRFCHRRSPLPVQAKRETQGGVPGGTDRSSRHARPCAGHPRLSATLARKSWMAVKPGHDEAEVLPQPRVHRLCLFLHVALSCRRHLRFTKIVTRDLMRASRPHEGRFAVVTIRRCGMRWSR
jgi:hypothetical protein